MEPRRLLAGITINGTANNDTFNLNANSYTLNGVTTPIAASVTGVTVNGLGGADTLTISNTPATRPVTVNGGTGTDTINVGTGNLSFVNANVTVNGGALADNDLVNVNNGSAPVAAGNEDGIALNPFNVEINGKTVSYTNVQRVVVTQSGNDSFNAIRQLDASLNVTIKGGGGNDMYEVGDGGNGGSEVSVTGVSDNIRGKLTIDAGANSGSFGDSFSFNDFNSETSTSYVMTDSAFTSPFAPVFKITYLGFEDMNINLGAAANKFVATTVTRGATWMLGGGADTIYGTTRDDTFQSNGDAPVEFHGGKGNDFLLGGPDFSDKLFGDEGNDTLDGGETSGSFFVRDSLSGGSGSDVVSNASGNDVYVFEPTSTAETDTIEANDRFAIGTLDFSLLTTPVNVNTSAPFVGNAETIATHANRTVKVTRTSGFRPVVARVLGGSAGDSIAGSNDFEQFYGNGGNDTITGGGSELSANGGDGNDLITGGFGDDSLEGGAGFDTLIGNDGADFLFGGADADTYVFANPTGTETDAIDEDTPDFGDTLDFSPSTIPVTVTLNADTLAKQGARTVITNQTGQFVNIENARGGSANDTITGNNGPDEFFGNGGNDSLVGLGDRDTLRGGTGNDTLDGGEGSDFLFGNENNDTYKFANAALDQNDEIIEFDDATGKDTLDFSAVSTPVTVDLNSEFAASHLHRTVVVIFNDLPPEVENVTGGSASDSLVGSDLANTIVGGGGNDTIRGGFGNDSLFGNGGNDAVNGDSGNDTLSDGDGNDTLAGGVGDDTYKFATTSVAQTDFINEGSNSGTDALDFTAVSTSVTVNLGSDTLATHVNRTVKTAGAGGWINLENANGGTAGDSITGNSRDNVLFGNAGNDTLNGLAGNDKLTGNSGLDQLLGGTENDTLFGADGEKDTLDGGTGTDSLGSSDAIDVKSNIP